ncbi:hypothetical protein D3C87_1313100 [compost metagenome]
MRPEQIEVIGFQSLQTLFNGANHVFAVVAGVGNAVGWRSPQRVFGRDDQPITFGRDELTEYGFGLATLIAVGGIDEIAACLQVTVENGFGFVTFRTMPPTRAEIAGTQGQFGNTQAGFTAKDLVMHGGRLLKKASCFILS